MDLLSEAPACQATNQRGLGQLGGELQWGRKSSWGKLPCSLARTLEMTDGFLSVMEVRNQDSGLSFQGWAPCQTGPQLPYL